MMFTRGTYVRQHRHADLTGAGSRHARRAQAYDAFVPATVADVDLSLVGATAADVADAERAVARLDGVAGRVEGFESLSRSLLRSEAVASSWMEALRVSHRTLAEAEHGAPGATYDEARRVVANVWAMALAVDLGSTGRPLEIDDLLSMHGMLMSGSTLRIDHERAGVTRDGPVFIGGVSPETAEYVGPPHDEIGRLLNDLIVFLNDRQDLSGIVLAAISHAQFESIHPFHDGNGRVGRCLIHTVLRRAGLTGNVFVPLSVVLARRGREYVDGLNAFRRDDLDGWISQFATWTTAAANAAEHFGVAIEQLGLRWNGQLADHRAAEGRRAVRRDAAVIRLIRELPGMPVLQINDVADRLDITWMAAKLAVDELEHVGVITNVSAGRRNRVYHVPELFSLVARFEERPDTFHDDL